MAAMHDALAKSDHREMVEQELAFQSVPWPRTPVRQCGVSFGGEEVNYTC